MGKNDLYAVSSLREYGNGEQYFSTDGIFRTEEEAKEYIRADILETLEEFKEIFDYELPESSVDNVPDEHTDYRIHYADKYFAWRVDHFRINDLSWESVCDEVEL